MGPALAFAVLAAALGGCRHPGAGGALPPALAEERIPPGEEKDISRLTELLLELQERRLLELGRPARRGQHAKHQGCVRAELEVLADAPPQARHGVFREPGRRYPAWIRFSNGDGLVKPDTERDARGMAVKLMGVEGETLLEADKDAGTQDFLLINHPVFFLRDVRDNVELFEALLDGRPRAFFLPGLNPFRWRIRELRMLRASISEKAADPLAETYFSALPSRLGSGAVKYSARPCGPVELEAEGTGPERLRETLARRLREEPACMLFMVQFQTDPVRMPIEDPTVRWDEEDSPFVPVARVHIPPQEFDVPARQEYCENLYYNPWHSLPEHRPLGGIQRARRKVYSVLSAFRRMKNRAPLREPGPTDPAP